MNRTTLGRLVGGLPAFRELVLASALLVFSGYASAVSAQTSFYDAPRSLLPGQPGTLVRQEPIGGAPLGAAAYRMLYRSTGMKGEPIFVSGVVVDRRVSRRPAAAPSSLGRIRPPASRRAVRRRWRYSCSSRSRDCARLSNAAMSLPQPIIPVLARPDPTHILSATAKPAR